MPPSAVTRPSRARWDAPLNGREAYHTGVHFLLLTPASVEIQKMGRINSTGMRFLKGIAALRLSGYGAKGHHSRRRSGAFGPPTPFEEPVGEVTALPQLGDGQFDGPGAGVPSRRAA